MDKNLTASWINDHSHQLVIAVTVRVALRHLGVPSAFDETFPHVLLVILRALLTTTIAATRPSDAVKAAAVAAELGIIEIYAGQPKEGPIAKSGYVPIRRLKDVSHMAVLAAQVNNFDEFRESAVDAISFAYRDAERNLSTAIDIDIDDVKLGHMEVLERPLFNQIALEPRRAHLVARLDGLFDADPVWDFWRRWYDLFVRGGSRDWELEHDIALIPDADWREGPAHLAGIIQQIEARRLQDTSVIAEVVSFNQEAERFDVEPIRTPREDVIRLALERVADSLDDAISIGRGQHVREESVETFVLRRVLRKYGDDPQRIEMDLSDMAALIDRQVASGEYPDNPELQQLVRALFTACGEICATHLEVRETRDRLDGQAPIMPLNQAQQAELVEALPVLQSISTERFGDAFEEDIRELVNDALLLIPDRGRRLPPAGPRVRAPRASVVRRLAYRTSSILVSIGSGIQFVDGTAAYKGARIVTTLGALIGLFRALLHFR